MDLSSLSRLKRMAIHLLAKAQHTALSLRVTYIES